MKLALGLAAALLLLQTILAINVSLRRLALKDYRHDTDRPEIKRAQLTHRNAMEHIPLLAIVIVGLALAGAPEEWVIAAGVGALIARTGHAAGYMVPALGRIKMLNSILGYTVEVLGCAGLLWLVLAA